MRRMLVAGMVILAAVTFAGTGLAQGADTPGSVQRRQGHRAAGRTRGGDRNVRSDQVSSGAVRGARSHRDRHGRHLRGVEVALDHQPGAHQRDPGKSVEAGHRPFGRGAHASRDLPDPGRAQRAHRDRRPVGERPPRGRRSPLRSCRCSGRLSPARTPPPVNRPASRRRRASIPRSRRGQTGSAADGNDGKARGGRRPRPRSRRRRRRRARAPASRSVEARGVSSHSPESDSLQIIHVKTPGPGRDAAQARARRRRLSRRRSARDGEPAPATRRSPRLRSARYVAQVTSTPGPAQPPPANGSKLISLDFKDADVVNLLRILAAESGRNIVDRRGRQGQDVDLAPQRALGTGARHHPGDARPAEDREGQRHPHRVHRAARQGARGAGAGRGGQAEGRGRGAHQDGRGPAEGGRGAPAQARRRPERCARRRRAGRCARRRSGCRTPIPTRSPRRSRASSAFPEGSRSRGRSPACRRPAAVGPIAEPTRSRTLPALQHPGPPVPSASRRSRSQDVLAKGLTIRAHKADQHALPAPLRAPTSSGSRSSIREALDIPLPQVKIEARMEILDRNALEQIGIQWGGGRRGSRTRRAGLQAVDRPGLPRARSRCRTAACSTVSGRRHVPGPNPNFSLAHQRASRLADRPVCRSAATWSTCRSARCPTRGPLPAARPRLRHHRDATST